MIDEDFIKKHNCLQCMGSGKLFFRNGKYMDCDVCQGTGMSERSQLWQIQGMIIKGWRIVNEITLRQAAIKFKIDPSNLSKMERGIIKPNPQYLKTILDLENGN